MSALRTAILKRWEAPAWNTFFEVANSTGFAKSRTADAVAVCTWPSRGMEIHGIEIKSFRSDWLRELKQPAKSEPVQRFCDRWWVVAENEAVVNESELPPTWGLLVLKGKKLFTVVDAPKLNAEPVSRAFMASILRSASARFVDKAVVDSMVEERLENRVSTARDSNALELQRLRADHAEVSKLLEDLAKGIGTNVYDLTHGFGWPPKEGEAIGKALRLVLDGGLAKHEGELEALRTHAHGILERITDSLDAARSTKRTDT